MFKRSLASLAVVAVASGAVVAPANAITVTVNKDMTCTIQLTAEETELTGLARNITSNKNSAAITKGSIVEGQLSTLRAKIENAKKELAELESHSEKSERLKRELEENEKKFTAFENLSNALAACIAGHNYDSNQPGPKQPGPKQPGPNNPEGPSKPGPKQPGPSKPGPNNPERERALPSTNGAVIGVIVAVLGILVAALPVIKSMLPAQLRALLP
ncbi:hypothetical protein [Corynebacterium diphtheriae]|uniref:hypothetical protein n=1 Tax=Corynebacterium diphtheriae TaxID=1717 RepID=UPI003531FA5A